MCNGDVHVRYGDICAVECCSDYMVLGVSEYAL